MNLTLSETGAIGLIGMLFGFLLACCRQIEQSRCTSIDVCGVKCNREPLSDDTILNMENQSQETGMEMPTINKDQQS